MENAWLYILITAMLVIGVMAILRDARRSTLTHVDEAPTHELRGNGSFDLEVVGESNYQEALRDAVGPGEVRQKVHAVLRLEPTNRFDANAVRVEVNGLVVGYLPREAAGQFTFGVKDTAMNVFAVNAVIVGGGEGRSLGIWLDIPVRS